MPEDGRPQDNVRESSRLSRMRQERFELGAHLGIRAMNGQPLLTLALVEGGSWFEQPVEQSHLFRVHYQDYRGAGIAPIRWTVQWFSSLRASDQLRPKSPRVSLPRKDFPRLAVCALNSESQSEPPRGSERLETTRRRKMSKQGLETIGGAATRTSVRSRTYSAAAVAA